MSLLSDVAKAYGPIVIHESRQLQPSYIIPNISELLKTISMALATQYDANFQSAKDTHSSIQVDYCSAATCLVAQLVENMSHHAAIDTAPFITPEHKRFVFLAKQITLPNFVQEIVDTLAPQHDEEMGLIIPILPLILPPCTWANTLVQDDDAALISRIYHGRIPCLDVIYTSMLPFTQAAYLSQLTSIYSTPGSTFDIFQAHRQAPNIRLDARTTSLPDPYWRIPIVPIGPNLLNHQAVVNIISAFDTPHFWAREVSTNCVSKLFLSSRFNNDTKLLVELRESFSHYGPTVITPDRGQYLDNAALVGNNSALRTLSHILIPHSLRQAKIFHPNSSSLWQPKAINDGKSLQFLEVVIDTQAHAFHHAEAVVNVAHPVPRQLVAIPVRPAPLEGEIANPANVNHPATAAAFFRASQFSSTQVQGCEDREEIQMVARKALATSALDAMTYLATRTSAHQFSWHLTNQVQQNPLPPGFNVGRTIHDLIQPADIENAACYYGEAYTELYTKIRERLFNLEYPNQPSLRPYSPLTTDNYNVKSHHQGHLLRLSDTVARNFVVAPRSAPSPNVAPLTSRLQSTSIAGAVTE